jgi:glycosyltransferase involved in cell wall biosynthesis
VTVVSEDLRRHFLERHDLRTSYIPNGLPTITKVPRGPVLEGLGLLKRRYIFFASRLTVEKGCHDLIEAHAALDNDVALVIAGKALQPDYEAHLKLLAGRDVMFVGHRSGRELQELYSNAALFVLPSYLEGMSMALLEAMAYGVPIVVSDIPENRRVVGNRAICFPVQDVVGLADALRLALSQGIDNSHRTAKWPTWATIAGQYGDVYDQVTAQPVAAMGTLYGNAP